MFTDFVHDVIDRDLADEAADTVDDRHSHEVIFLEVDGHILYRGIGAYADRVGLHHMLYAGDGGMGDHLLERQHAAQPVVVVDDVDIIDIVEVFGLASDLLDAVRHRHILVDLY